jgi:hypothetical protein
MADRRIKEFHVCLIHSRQTIANKPSKSHSGSRQYRHEFATGNPQSAKHHGKDFLTYIAGQIRYLY